MVAYSRLDRLLHRLALKRRPVAELAFDIEQTLLRRDSRGIAEERHVFVVGLARAGTTALLRRLHASGAFRSLTYRDMPFVLAPGLWRRLSGFARRGRGCFRGEGTAVGPRTGVAPASEAMHSGHRGSRRCRSARAAAASCRPRSRRRGPSPAGPCSTPPGAAHQGAGGGGGAAFGMPSVAGAGSGSGACACAKS